MKIVHILNSNKFSGAENVAIQIINWTKKNENIDCVYMSPKGDIEEKLRENNIESYLVENISAKTIKKMISDIQPDILHCHDYTASILASIVTNRRIISHIHNNAPWIKKYGIYSWVFLFSCIRYSDILLVSNSIKNEYVFSKYISDKFRIIGNPIDVDLIKDNSQAFECDHYDIVFLGRMTPAKNPFSFLNVIEKLKIDFPDICACMIGNGELYELVKEKIHDKKLQNHIKLLGFQDNPYPYLKNCKLVLGTSAWEGFGLFAVEALALGRPVVCTRVGGLKDIVDLSCGYLCDNEEELVVGCKALLSNEKIYHNKTEGALKKIRLFNNKEAYMNLILNIYKGVNLNG